MKKKKNVIYRIRKPIKRRRNNNVRFLKRWTSTEYICCNNLIYPVADKGIDYFFTVHHKERDSDGIYFRRTDRSSDAILKTDFNSLWRLLRPIFHLFVMSFPKIKTEFKKIIFFLNSISKNVGDKIGNARKSIKSRRHDEFESVFRVLLASLDQPVRWKQKPSNFIHLACDRQRKTSTLFIPLTRRGHRKPKTKYPV